MFFFLPIKEDIPVIAVFMGGKMSALRFIITRSSLTLSLHGERYVVPANSLAVTCANMQVVSDVLQCKPIIVDFSAAALQQLYPDVIELIETERNNTFSRNNVKVIKAENDVIDVFSSLSNLSPDSFLYFSYIYCLSIDRNYFSALLKSSISGNKAFCHFIETNFMQPWSVAQLAEEIGLPLRKFNQQFQDVYGKPAKRWLLERRLEHAKRLLSSTPMRVLDIALECGFSNHAHFTDSFRRNFMCSPKQFRYQSHGKVDNDGILNGEE